MEGCLSEPGEEGVKADSTKPLGTSLPGLTIRRERKREEGWLHPDSGNVASLRRGRWMEVTMISRGVEISIAGGIAETEDANYSDLFFYLFFFFLISIINCFYGGKRTPVLIPRS